jgi:hypothetical protein
MTSPAQPRFREVVGSDGRVVPDRGDRPRHPGVFTGMDGVAAVGRHDGGQFLRVRLRLRREVPTGGARLEPVPDVLVAFHARRAMAFMSSACSSHEPFPPVRAMGSQYHRTRRSTDALKSARTVLPDMRTT